MMLIHPIRHLFFFFLLPIYLIYFGIVFVIIAFEYLTFFFFCN